MSRQHWAEIFVAAEYVQNALGEDSGGQLSQFQRSIGTIRRWLPDEGVPDEQGGNDLDNTEQHRKVPRDDANTYADGNIAKHKALL